MLIDMKMLKELDMYLVTIVKMPKVNDFQSGYFPRKIYYKKDALELAREVEAKGGKAIVERIPKTTYQATEYEGKGRDIE